MGETTQKTVALILTNQTDDPRIITLTPGMTVAQALVEGRLRSDHTIKHPDSDHNLDNSEDLFALVDDGEKLKVTPGFVAGSWWNPLSWRRPNTSPVPLPPVSATSPTDARWLRRYGWQPDGNAWRGFFRVAGRPPLRAYIDLHGAVPRACLENPPEAIQRHVCVHRLANAPGWFYVNEHGALPGRTLRGFVTSVETWIENALKSATRSVRAAVPSPRPTRSAVSQRGGMQMTNEGGDW